MFHHRVAFLSLVLAASGCGEDFTADRGPRGTTTFHSQVGGGESTSDTSTGGEGGQSTSDSDTLEGGAGGSGGAGGIGGTGGSGAQGGSGGSEPGFFAQCVGTVDCPTMTGCADWEYVIDDDGTTTVVTAQVTLADPGLSCSDQTQYASLEDEGMQVAGNIMFPCDFQTWAFGIDKSTKLVYVKEMTQGYSWTPVCQ